MWIKQLRLGGARDAATYTILRTVKLNDLNPQSWLRYILERITDHPVNRIKKLLPWNVAPLLEVQPQLAVYFLSP